MISKEEVIHIAQLSRLELSGKEFEKMQKDLSEILDYFKLLKSQKSTTKSTAKQAKNLNRTRTDEVLQRDADLADKLLTLAPQRKERYIKVKSIL